MASILLIYPKPNVFKDTRFGFSLNLLYISAILKQYGHEIIFKDYSTDCLNPNELKEILTSVEVCVLELDSFPLKRTTNIKNGEELINYIKTFNQSIKIIAMGSDCILLPRKIPGVDYMFSIEPEKSINDVVDSLLTVKEIKTPEPLKDLDTLPFPDRNLISEFVEHGGTFYKKPNLARSTLVQTSRGCLNSCVFCQRKGWLKDYKIHSNEYVINEFSQLAEHNYINIWITDDNFTFNLNRAKKLLRGLSCSQITQGMKISLSSWTNIDTEFLDLAKLANVTTISYGIESSNSEILAFYKKKVDLDRTRQLIEYANQLGLYSVGNFIIGAPMETNDTIERTFNYILETPFDQVNIKILDYMIGSELYNTISYRLPPGTRHIFACRENGLNNLAMTEMVEKIKEFTNIYNLSTKERLYKKLLNFGMPYEPVDLD